MCGVTEPVEAVLESVDCSDEFIIFFDEFIVAGIAGGNLFGFGFCSLVGSGDFGLECINLTGDSVELTGEVILLAENTVTFLPLGFQVFNFRCKVVVASGIFVLY